MSISCRCIHCMFVIEVLQKSKYHFVAPPWQTPERPQGPSICKFFSFKCTTALWSGKENVILTRRPFGQSLSKITAVSWNVDQSKPDSHFDSQIDPYFLCILIEYVYSRRQHKCQGKNTVPGSWGTLIKHKCLAHTQNWLLNALVEKGEGGLNNFRVRNLGKQIRHLTIFRFNFS